MVIMRKMAAKDWGGVGGKGGGVRDSDQGGGS